MTDPVHYRQEIIQLRSDVVDLVSRHAPATSIPIPAGMIISEVMEAISILNNSDWEVIGVDDGWIFFKRYVVGEYAK